MSEPLHTPYGFCPQCGSPGSTRERRPNGNDRCFNGHIYPTVAAVLVKTKGLDECSHAKHSVNPGGGKGEFK